MKNYYQILGVEKTASQEEIKRAYRKMASLYHPDKEGGSKARFQEVEEAYRTVGDPQKRAMYDNPQPHFNMGGGGFDFESIFDIFGSRFQHPHQQRRAHQRAIMTLWITIQDVARFGPKTISVGTHQGTQAVEIEIPPGINDGDSVQYPGIGPGGMDLVITFRIHPNPRWERQGNNLISNQPVDIWDLILGCEIDIQDILGATLSLSIPPNTQPNTMLKLRGRGLQDRSGQVGDLLVRVQARIPANIPEDLLDMIRSKFQK